MDSKKSKKKLFAIIGSSVLAFILTVVVSVAVTLAYFGDTDEASTTATMDKAVTVGLTVTEDAVQHVLPGEKVDVEAKATVEAGVSGAFVAIKVNPTTAAAEGVDGALATTAPAIVLADGSTWTKVGSYYYYTTEAGTDEDTSAQLKQVADGEVATLTGSFIVDETLDNDYAESTITVTFSVIVVQGEAFEDGKLVSNATISDALEMFDQYDDTIVTETQVEGN